jgi:hypothetical protein
MSTKLHFLPADPVHYWTAGIRGWILDRENYRITAIFWSPYEYVAPPIELGREMWEKLEQMASGD